MAKPSYFRTTRTSDTLIARLTPGEPYGIFSSDGFSDELAALYAGEGTRRVLVDFAHVEAISSSVIAVLLGFRKRLKADGVQLALCGMSDHLREKLRVLQLDGTVFQVYDTRNDAVTATVH